LTALNTVLQMWRLGNWNVLLGKADFPAHAFAAFDHIHLEAGQSQSVTLHVMPRRLECWSKSEDK